MLIDQLAPERVDPRVKRTRLLLEQAFMDIIQEKGFQAVTVQDITERAGVNRATFYAHFADKYALLDHCIRQGFLQEIDKRMLNACHLTTDNLRNLIVAVCEFIHSMNSHCKPAQAQFESLVETQVKAVLHELMLKWLEPRDGGVSVPPAASPSLRSGIPYVHRDDVLREDLRYAPAELRQAPLQVSPEMAATAASWAIYGLALQWSHAKQPEPVEKFAAEVLPLVEANLNLSTAA
jgi:AcrR family transcriptional regulator